VWCVWLGGGVGVCVGECVCGVCVVCVWVSVCVCGVCGCVSLLGSPSETANSEEKLRNVTYCTYIP